MKSPRLRVELSNRSMILRLSTLMDTVSLFNTNVKKAEYQGLSKTKRAQGHIVVVFLSLTNGTYRTSAAAATNGNPVWSPLNMVLYSKLRGNAFDSYVANSFL